MRIRIFESERRLSADRAELAARTFRENTENIQRVEDFSRIVTLKKESLIGEIAVRKDCRSKAEEKIKELTPRLDEAGARLNSLLLDIGMDLEGFHRLKKMDADALNSAIDAFTKEDM